ncbi:uncharacterized protein LOC133913751 isoform X2 [Phragmites australis]|uniref:uncharacterized protein LOC133913751 isoform X2 n=1 Tax=Phragmites australis TaxID=29695 RepID=UPI002D7A330A|nr:uncharacterized protein LOC133913751 isoform X2 [Phragmites australis]
MREACILGSPRRRRRAPWKLKVAAKGEAPAMLEAPPPAVAGGEERTCRSVFLEFMTRVARFGELAESGKRLLVRFHQELVCSCEDGLKDHINKVKTLLEELECLVEDVYGITLTASLSALEVSDSPSIDNKLKNEPCFMEEKQQADQLDSDVSLVTVMVIVHKMLKLDYMMQEKIVSALSPKTPSSELEGYCLMWDLRPYVDDNMMHLAWTMSP